MSEMANESRASLSRVVRDLGDLFLEVVAGEVNAHPHVTSVVIHDLNHATPPAPGAVVLGVGVHGPEMTSMLLESLGRTAAAALIVRSPVDNSEPTLRAAREAGIVLIALAESADWLTLADMLRTVISQDDIGDEVTSMLGGVPAGDLFALANAVAALIDAPITIEDRSYRVLAFSGRQGEADQARVETILDRQVPDVYLREDEGRGVFQALYRTDGVLYVEASSVTPNEIPRAAVAVRAGDEILGSMWAAVHEPLSDERGEAFVDAAKLVALHLLRRRAGADVDQRLRSDLVATALEGGPKAAQAMARLGLLGRSVTVVAMDILEVSGDDADRSRQTSDRQRMADAFSMHLSAVAPRSAMALLGDVAYGLVPLTGDLQRMEERAKRVAADFLGRTGSRVPTVIGVGPAVDDPSRLDDSRARADRALRVLRSRGRGGEVATLPEVHIDALVLDLQDLSAARNDPLIGPLSLLLEYDAKRDSSLLATLEHYLDAFGDVHAAAVAAGVHHNTFRYRLKRVSEIGHLDLEDAEQRFAIQLQLRLMRSGATSVPGARRGRPDGR
jgi:hypothetical protein